MNTRLVECILNLQQSIKQILHSFSLIQIKLSLLDIKIRHYKFKPSQKFYVTNIICAGKFVNRNNHNILFTLYDNHSIHYFYYSEIPFYLYNT